MLDLSDAIRILQQVTLFHGLDRAGLEALARAARSVQVQPHPRIALNTIEDLSAHIQELRERYLELATQCVERRVAHALLRLADRVGWRNEEGMMIDVSLSRKDLAEMTGTTLYTVSRTLRGWQRRGLVKAGRQHVTLLQPQGLIAIAEDRPTKVRSGESRAKPGR